MKLVMEKRHLKCLNAPYNDPFSLSASSHLNATLLPDGSPHLNSALLSDGSPHLNSALLSNGSPHLNSALLSNGSPHLNSALLSDGSPHLNSAFPPDVSASPHLSSALPQGFTLQSLKHGYLSPISRDNGCDFTKLDEPSLSFIDQEIHLLPAPLPSLDQLSCYQPHPLYCSTLIHVKEYPVRHKAKRSRSPTNELEAKRRPLLLTLESTPQPTGLKLTSQRTSLKSTPQRTGLKLTSQPGHKLTPQRTSLKLTSQSGLKSTPQRTGLKLTPQPGLKSTPQRTGLKLTSQSGLKSTPQPGLKSTPQRTGLKLTSQSGLKSTPQRTGLKLTPQRTGLKSTPQPGLKLTPQPGLKSTSQPGLKSTPQPGLKLTPQPGLKSTPQRTGLKSTPQRTGLKSTPQPGLKSTPQPTGFKSTSQPTGFKSTSQPTGFKSTSQPAGLKLTSQPACLMSTPQPGHLDTRRSTQQNKAAQKRMFIRRQAKIPKAVVEQSRKHVIDVDTYKPKATASLKVQYWIPELKLTVHDKDVLLNPLGWLTDNLINAAQELIRREYQAVPSLQDVTNGRTLSYDGEAGEFVQIVHNQHGHWLTISTIGVNHPAVSVYDSMYRSVSTQVKAQIAALLHTEAR